ncbi:hypothetical protein BRADI_2g57473v3 [Brachypodium distachyon]|uniref:Uncharacterized protein n=1 Tax=Brachypodium distachyon TaxID=15368 RepID=A0A2K2DGF3_BRADI|nr:hypothetical protein BRADI_2g57473v3 [Brachypodium distachyon]
MSTTASSDFSFPTLGARKKSSTSRPSPSPCSSSRFAPARAAAASSSAPPPPADQGLAKTKSEVNLEESHNTSTKQNVWANLHGIRPALMLLQ